MKKPYKLIIGLLLMIVAIAAYFLSPLTIFPTPKIATINVNSADYQQSAVGENTLCYNRTLPLPSVSAEKTDYKMLVWNLHKGEDQGWQQALRRYADKADFVLLQEATQQNHIEQVLANRTWHGVHAATFAYRENMSGVMLLSTFALQQYCVGSEIEPWIRIPKIAQTALYPLGADRTLLVINLHLVNFEWNPLNYARQLREMFRLISQHQGAIILAGDFNSWSERRLNLITELAQQYGLEEVRFTPDERMRFFDNPLDHIFVRDIQIKHAWTEQTEASDHNPLLLEFSTLSIK